MAVSVGGRPSASKPARNPFRRFLGIRESAVFLVLAVMYVVMWFVSPVFRARFNQVSILSQMAVFAVLAIGQTMVIVSGGFDLSQGPIAALAGMLSALSIKSWGWSPLVGIGFGLLIGLLCGIFNGVIITRLQFEPVVATLAASSIYSGIMYSMTKGNTVVDLPAQFTWLGSGDLGPLPAGVVLMFVLYALMQFVLTTSEFGRHVFLIGSNKEAARLAGINVERTQFGIFLTSALVASLGGIMLAGRISAAQPQMGANLMLPTVAAAIVGGTWLTGGVGSMFGTLMGAAIMAVLKNAIVVLRVNIYLQEFVVGLVVVAAVLIDQIRRGNLSLNFLRRKAKA